MSKGIKYEFQGETFTLPFEITAPLHIPEGWMQPPADYEISFDFDGAPAFYYRDKVDADFFDAQVYLEPETGKEAVCIEFNAAEATAEEIRAALTELNAWFATAVEAKPLRGESN